MTSSLRDLLPFARGEVPSDLVIRGARVANVLSLEFEEVDVAVARGTIVGMGEGFEGREVLDARGSVLIPGLLDGHLHIESSCLTPSRFAEIVVPRGTTGVFADPHEIANVLGAAGVRGMAEASRGLPLDVFLGAPSCVPASPFETCRVPLGAADLAGLFADGTCQHLGEMMNYPGVVAGDREVWAKIAAAGDRPLTAHAPGLSGRALGAYALSGCDGDHESTSLEEGREKLRRGFWVMMRGGSVAPDLEALAPLLREDPARAGRCMGVSDDVDVRTLLEEGHQDAKLRRLCARGVDPLAALRCLTLSPAEYFRLPRRGAIAPGWRADLALVDSLETCRVHRVWKDGVLVARDGRLCVSPDHAVPPALLDRGEPLPPLDRERLRVPAAGRLLRVLGARPGSLLTENLLLPPRVEEGQVVPDPERDLVKLAVRERHTGSGRLGVGFVRGLGLRRGALGASVAHDAHNHIAAGADDRSLFTALRALEELGGGFVAAEGDRILAALPLPVGGLMNPGPGEETARLLEEVDRAVRGLGVEGLHPCMALSFLSLSVIPRLKLTDRGYVDLEGGGLLGLFED